MIGRALIPIRIFFNLIQNKHFTDTNCLEKMYSKISENVIKPLLVATPNKVILISYNVALFIIPGYTCAMIAYSSNHSNL